MIRLRISIENETGVCTIGILLPPHKQLCTHFNALSCNHLKYPVLHKSGTQGVYVDSDFADFMHIMIHISYSINLLTIFN